MSERLDFQAWMKPEAMWHLAPRAFSSYSWPAAAVSIKAGVQAAVVGAWLNQAPSEAEWDAAQLLYFSILAGETPVNVITCRGAGGRVAGHLSGEGCSGRTPPGSAASGTAPWWAGPAICTARGPLLHWGIGATHSSSRGAASQPGNSHGHPVVSPLESV